MMTIRKIENIHAPWKIDVPIGAEHPQIRDKDGRRIAIVASSWPTRPTTEDKHVALMCAAPELYEALCNLLSRIENDRDASQWFIDEQEAAKRAIEKAQGKR